MTFAVATKPNIPPALCGPALHHAIFDVLAKHLKTEQQDPSNRSGRTQYFIFGSEATGTPFRSSDIDIGLWGPEPIPAKTLENLREELESLPTLRTFDLVDFADVSGAVRTKALQNIIVTKEEK